MLNKINCNLGRQKLIVYIVLSIVTLAVYGQVNQYDFVNFDDNLYVTENNHIQSGITLDGFRWAFVTKHMGLWNPLVWLSFMLDCQLYHLNAGGYHLTNLFLHILSTLLLFWLFSRMTQAIWKSAFVAALFAFHPLHVESVAWISERKDVLSALFWMLTLCLYVYYTEKPAIKRYLLVLFCFACALMSKPIVVTLPIIMMLLDFWPLNRFQARKDSLILWQLKEKLPLFILSAAIIIITFYTPGKMDVKHSPFISRLANAPVSFVTYLEKTFWPHDMAVFYPFPTQIPIWQIIGASVLIILITALVIAMAKRQPYLFVGWLWFVITIAPVIGVIQISAYAMADHYHYLPSIGIAIMLAWGIPNLFKRENIRKKILFPAAIIFLAVMGFLSWQQCGYWKNSFELFTHVLQVTKHNYIAHNYLGVALYDQGKLNESIVHYNKAMLIKTDYAEAYINRGNASAKLNQYQRAIDDYNEAIYLKQDYVEAYINRGVAYAKLGHFQRAIDDFSKAIDFNPDYAKAYLNRGVIYIMQGNNDFGCRDMQKACALGNCQLLEVAKSKGFCR